MVSDLKIDFQILDTDVEPEEITAFLGVNPSTALKKGQRNAKLVLPKINIWSLESNSDSDELVVHWEQLSSKLIGNTEKIKEIASKGYVKFTIVINTDENQRMPSIIIPADMSLFAGKLNAIIDIDHMQ